MFTSLQEISNKLSISFDEIDNMNKNIIINIFNGNTNNYINEKDTDMNIANYIAMYYNNIKKNYQLMEKYYMIAIEKGNSSAMNNLACYYRDQKKYEMMEKYYMMAIEKDNSYAMNNLACYYRDIKFNYDNMIKYYTMSIKKNNTTAIYNLGLYYHYIEFNYTLMKKYYMMTITNNINENINNMINIEINNILDDFNNKINNLNLKNCNKEEECIVCYNTDNMYYTRCNNHSICMNCSLKLYEEPCPMCRQ
jgi:TPR repeat protein